jgi:hypothetical protein
MLTKVKKRKDQLSTSQRFGASVGWSQAFNKESLPAKAAGREMTTRPAPPEIQAAQQLLARIAARILIGSKTDEQQGTSK